MRGWFDLARENGGPTLYAHSNRTPVIGDVTTITLVTVFATLYIAFFIIFPGVRRERFTTFLSVTLSLFVGTAILIGNNGTSWHVGEAEISSAYRAFSNEKIMGKLGVYIGLSHANVTLAAMPVYYNTTMDVNFNERFRFDGPDQLKDEYRTALEKGLPFPILTVAEYMAVDAEGFCWGRNYRSAGYYTSIYLWFAFAMWLCMNLLLVIVPRYGAYMMASTGAMMCFADLVYLYLLPSRELVIHVEDVTLTFELGWCFWLILTAGLLCLLVGASISVIDLVYPHKFSTILEMDYGTPFDRHTIIEDSHETKKKKKTNNANRLEEPTSVGFGGLLRRLSKRDRDPHGHHHSVRFPGHDNYAFEMEAPKSPWRYPHLMFRADSRKQGGHKSVSFKQSGGDGGGGGSGRNHLELPPGAIGAGRYGFLRRTDSKDSECSSLSSVPHQGRDELRTTLSVPPLQLMQAHHGSGGHHKFRRTDSSESSNSSLASFGGLSAILSRNNSKKRAHKHNAAVIAGGVAGAGPQVTLVGHGHGGHAPVERADSGQSVISRGYTVQDGAAAASGGSTPPNGASGSSSSVGASAAPGASVVTVGKSDEVAIIVSGRKNSLTKAVRRNSAEHQRSEASMW